MKKIALKGITAKREGLNKTTNVVMGKKTTYPPLIFHYNEHIEELWINPYPLLVDPDIPK